MVSFLSLFKSHKEFQLTQATTTLGCARNTPMTLKKTTLKRVPNLLPNSLDVTQTPAPNLLQSKLQQLHLEPLPPAVYPLYPAATLQPFNGQPLLPEIPLLQAFGRLLTVSVILAEPAIFVRGGNGTAEYLPPTALRGTLILRCHHSILLSALRLEFSGTMRTIVLQSKKRKKKKETVRTFLSYRRTLFKTEYMRTNDRTNHFNEGYRKKEEYAEKHGKSEFNGADSVTFYNKPNYKSKRWKKYEAKQPNIIKTAKSMVHKTMAKLKKKGQLNNHNKKLFKSASNNNDSTPVTNPVDGYSVLKNTKRTIYHDDTINTERHIPFSGSTSTSSIKTICSSSSSDESLMKPTTCSMSSAKLFQAGEYRYHFELPVSHEIYESVETAFGSVQYTLAATIESPVMNSHNRFHNRLFSLKTPLSSENGHKRGEIRVPVARTPADPLGPASIVTQAVTASSHELECQVSVIGRTFAPGDVVPLHLHLAARQPDVHVAAVRVHLAQMTRCATPERYAVEDFRKFPLLTRRSHWWRQAGGGSGSGLLRESDVVVEPNVGSPKFPAGMLRYHVVLPHAFRHSWLDEENRPYGVRSKRQHKWPHHCVPASSAGAVGGPLHVQHWIRVVVAYQAPMTSLRSSFWRRHLFAPTIYDYLVTMICVNICDSRCAGGAMNLPMYSTVDRSNDLLNHSYFGCDELDETRQCVCCAIRYHSTSGNREFSLLVRPEKECEQR